MASSALNANGETISRMRVGTGSAFQMRRAIGIMEAFGLRFDPGAASLASRLVIATPRRRAARARLVRGA
jgi:hypothetical protein